MTKFRKWLIKKLGGYIKEDFPEYFTPVKYTKIEMNLVPIKAQLNLDNFKIMQKNYSDEYLEHRIKQDLKNELLKHIEPEYILENNPDYENSITAKLELPSKYIKEQ